MELFASLLILTTPAAQAPPSPALTQPPAIERASDLDSLLTLATQAAPTAVVQPAGSRAIDLADLDSMRGGDGGVTAVITDQTLTAINANNSLNAQTIGSGDISLGAGAFAGFAGIGNFAVNSGHNNNLQANVSISINLTPAVGP